MTARIGQGFDVHAYAAGDGIRLGGVTIPCDLSIVAHSDGDVLIHALCDALLGALGRGDIGRLFADDDPANAGRDSREFLAEVAAMASADGWRLGNADLGFQVVEEDRQLLRDHAPRLAAHVDAIETSLATVLGCGVDRLNVKATTTERLGFTGREEGIAALAVVLLEPLP